MRETIPERTRRYLLDSSDEDLQRLLNIAELSAEPTRAAFRKIGIKPGWRVIDCGCGPLGALAVMAEMVGPEGQVVGIDFSEPAVQRARSISSALGLDNVEVRVGDVHDIDGQALGSAFDLAYTRLFLMHQRDPAQTMKRIAALLRPGGWIVAHEPLRSPPPRSSQSSPRTWCKNSVLSSSVKGWAAQAAMSSLTSLSFSVLGARADRVS
jgi:SAM-dependent methyltransferase